jgi:hypothetical protein
MYTALFFIRLFIYLFIYLCLYLLFVIEALTIVAFVLSTPPARCIENRLGIRMQRESLMLFLLFIYFISNYHHSALLLPDVVETTANVCHEYRRYIDERSGTVKYLLKY